MNKRWLWILIGVIAFFLVLFSGAVAGAGLTYFALQASPARAALDKVIEPVFTLESASEDGVLVQHVEEGSPAEEAGIRRGNIILEVDGQQVNSMIELMDSLEGKSAGDTVVFTVQQCETTKNLSIKLEQRNGHIYLGLHLARERLFETPPFNPGGAVIPIRLSGFVVSQVIPDSPADEAGLRPGSVIVAINGDEFQPEDELADIVQTLHPGDEITLSVLQPGDGDPRQLTVILGSNPEDEDLAYMGIEYSRMPGIGAGPFPIPNLPPNFTPFKHEFPQLPEGIEQAVVVRSVTLESPAAEAGLESGDVITEINGEPVADFESFIESIRNFEPGDEVTLTVYRNGESDPTEIDVTLGEDSEAAGQPYLGVSIGRIIRFEYNGPGQDLTNPFHYDYFFPWHDRTHPRERLDTEVGEEA